MSGVASRQGCRWWWRRRRSACCSARSRWRTDFRVFEAVLMSASDLWRRQPDGRHRTVRPASRAVAGGAVDLRGEFPPRALFRRRRPAHRALADVQQAIGFFFLTDPQYAEAEIRAERGEKVGFAWYMGMALPIYVCWVAEGWIGATFGRLIPDTHALGIDFLLPIYFLGLVMGFRSGRCGCRWWSPAPSPRSSPTRRSARPGTCRSARLAGMLFAAAMPPHTGTERSHEHDLLDHPVAVRSRPISRASAGIWCCRASNTSIRASRRR